MKTKKQTGPAPAKDSTPAEENTGMGHAQRMPITIHAQYIKDLSFESPHAPASFRMDGETPGMDVSFSMDARNIELDGLKNPYEVTLGVRVTAKKGSQVAFLAEVEYGLAVTAENVSEDQLHPLLLIEMPRYAFPFVRQIIANITQQAGYAPLLLMPVDFRALYMQRFSQNTKIN